MPQAFERADACCSYGCYLLFSCNADKFCDDAAGHGDEFAVHVMFADTVAFDWAECSGADVQGHFLNVYFSVCDVLHQLGREVQTGCRSGYGAVDVAVDGLIVILVGFFRTAVQIWRNGDFTDGGDDVGK